MKRLDASKIKDEVTERVCLSIREAVRELQDLVSAKRIVIRNVRLNGTTTNIPTNVPHGLGRAPQMVRVSPPRVDPANLGALTAGLIVDSGPRMFNGDPLDRTQTIQLGAFGFAVPIVVDVEVS